MWWSFVPLGLAYERCFAGLVAWVGGGLFGSDDSFVSTFPDVPALNKAVELLNKVRGQSE